MFLASQAIKEVAGSPNELVESNKLKIVERVEKLETLLSQLFQYLGVEEKCVEKKCFITKIRVKK